MANRKPKHRNLRLFVLLGKEERIRRRASAVSARVYTRCGTTKNFTVSYANTLGTKGKNMANAVLASCERDLAVLEGYFGDITLGRLPFRIFIDPGQGGAWHASCAATQIHIDAFAGTNGNLETMLNVAEVSEVFMANQNSGWDCGASNGEGLSRVLAAEAYPAELDGFATAAAWLDSNREDFVTKNDGTDTNYVSIGCSALFLNYLRYQLGFSWDQIIQRGGTTLAQTYQNLTGQTDAFTGFAALMQRYFPAGTPSGLTTDNPFPLPRRHQRGPGK